MFRHHGREELGWRPGLPDLTYGVHGRAQSHYPKMLRTTMLAARAEAAPKVNISPDHDGQTEPSLYHRC